MAALMIFRSVMHAPISYRIGFVKLLFFVRGLFGG